MAEIKFSATVSNVVKFEKTTGESMMTAFREDNMSVGTIVSLTKALSDATDETIDAYVKEHGLEKLITGVVDALAESGFLPREAQKETTKGNVKLA